MKRSFREGSVGPKLHATHGGSRSFETTERKSALRRLRLCGQFRFGGTTVRCEGLRGTATLRRVTSELSRTSGRARFSIFTTTVVLQPDRQDYHNYDKLSRTNRVGTMIAIIVHIISCLCRQLESPRATRSPP